MPPQMEARQSKLKGTLSRTWGWEDLDYKESEADPDDGAVGKKIVPRSV